MALVHRWKFENDLNDSVGSSNGSNTNCTFYPNDNINGNYSIYIPKTPTGYPTFPDINIASYTNFTWAFWFRSVISGVQQYLVMDWTYPGAPDERLALVLNTNNRLIIYPYVGGKFGAIYSTTNFNIAAWNHVVLTASGTGSTYYTLYLNGKYDIAGTSSRSTYNTNTFRLGVHSPGVTAAKFDGYMDDFRFYDTALTADEVMNLYKSYATPIWQTPISRWALDGNANDAYGLNNGTAVGSVSYSTSLKVFGSQAFTNSGGPNYIDLGSFRPYSSYTSFTWSLWFKTSYSAANQALFGQYTLNNDYVKYMIYLLDGTYYSAGVVAVFCDDATTIKWYGTTTSTYTDGNWHFVALTDDNGTAKLYIDGKLTNVTGSYTRFTMASDKCHIGYEDPASPVKSFNGQIDDVRVYDVALSAADVRALYNSYFTEKAVNFISSMV